MSLPEPVGKQANVVHLPGNGHQVVLGTAGTGKTTMAMWRAAHLARPQTRNTGPVLLVTYNNALVTYLRHLSPGTARQVTVETYGRFARGYLHHLGLMPSWGGIATPAQRRSFVSAAVAECLQQHPRSQLLRTRDTGFFLDELEWISGMGIATLGQYQATKRFGRQSAAGPRYDWYDIATAVRRALAADDQVAVRPRLRRVVVVGAGTSSAQRLLSADPWSTEAVSTQAAGPGPRASLGGARRLRAGAVLACQRPQRHAGRAVPGQLPEHRRDRPARDRDGCFRAHVGGRRGPGRAEGPEGGRAQADAGPVQGPAGRPGRRRA